MSLSRILQARKLEALARKAVSESNEAEGKPHIVIFSDNNRIIIAMVRREFTRVGEELIQLRETWS